jgi:hypothetical protein
MVLEMRTAALCLVVVLLPSLLLVIGALPSWATWRSRPLALAALRGVNAAVVGLLLAALFRPVWTTGIVGAVDFALAIVAFLPLFMWRTPPSLVVLLCAAGPAPRRCIGVVALAIISMFNCRGPPIGTGFARADPVERPSDQTGGWLLPRLGVWECADGVAPRRRRPPRVETANGRLATGRRLTERYP